MDANLCTMDLNLTATIARFKSGRQIARVLSETWGAENLYCSACNTPHIERTPNNMRAIDFLCPGCGNAYQMKSTQRISHRSIPDAGYEAMIQAINSQQVPNLLYLHYDSNELLVRNLVLIPKFFFTPQVIKKRAPLGDHCDRKGWVGCIILLHRIPSDGRIPLITDGQVIPTQTVRASYRKLSNVSELDVSGRGWLLDVLNIIRRQGWEHFTLDDIYRFEPELAVIHPNNNFIKDKTRQQLQRLRDLGLLRFENRGHYTVIG